MRAEKSCTAGYLVDLFSDLLHHEDSKYVTGYSTVPVNFFTGRLSRFVLYSEAREASRPLPSTLWLGLRGSSQCESDCESLCFTSNLHTRRAKESAQRRTWCRF